MISYNTMIVLLGVGLLGAAAGLVGSFAVLRRRALLGDALAHAALPGLCLAFLVVGERNLSAMLLGALLTGLLGIATVFVIRQATRVKEDAAIGIVLSVYFGAGIVLSRIIQNKTTTGSKAGLDSYILGKTAGIIASDVLLSGAVALACVVLVTLLFKEFRLVSFDLGFARVQGWPARRLDLMLTALIAVVVVIGLPAVGVVLMAALLIIPGAAARFWTERLSWLVVLAGIFGVVMGLVGIVISATFDKMPAGPVITLVGTALFVVSALAAPRRGLVANWLARRRDAWQATHAELLQRLFEIEERGGRIERNEPSLAEAIRAGDVMQTPAGYTLTDASRTLAAELVRRERMWRLLIAEYPDLASHARPLTDDPPEAVLPADVIAELSAKLGDGGRTPARPTERESQR